MIQNNKLFIIKNNKVSIIFRSLETCRLHSTIIWLRMQELFLLVQQKNRKKRLENICG